MEMDYWLKFIERHNQGKQTSRIENRNCVTVVGRASWCGSTPEVSLYPQGEYTHGGRRFTCIENGLFDARWFGATFWRCDPVQRTMVLGMRWTPSPHTLWRFNQMFPRDVHLRYAYATRWNWGQVCLTVGDRRLRWSRDLVLHVPKDGPTTVLEGAVPATQINRTPHTKERLKFIMKRVRDMREMWEPFRQGTTSNNEIFCEAAIEARHANRKECIAHVVRWAESEAEHDPNVYASYIALRDRIWGELPEPWVETSDRYIRRAVCEVEVVS